MTWNVHRAVGRDGSVCARRVERVILDEARRCQPQVLALQEADSDAHPHAALLDTARIARETGLASLHDRARMRWSDTSGGFLGNIVFLHPRLEVTYRRIVELSGHCPRAAVLAETRTARDVDLRFVACHLSLSQPLRAMQLRLIGQVIARRPRMQTVLLGDLNEWRPWGGLALSRRVTGMTLAGPAVATFPAGCAVLSLDRILSHPGTVRDAVALDGPGIRAASDHRPLFARVAIAGKEAA